MAALGALAVLALVVIAFLMVSRTERLAARRARERTTSRQYADVALAAAMERLAELLALNGDSGSAQQATELEGVVSANAMASFNAGTDLTPILDLATGQATNLLPALLWAEAQALRPRWIPIVGVNEETGENTSTNGYVAYIVLNGSGFLDVHTVNSNQVGQLLRDGTDVAEANAFFRDRARDTAPVGPLVRYLSLADLQRRNRGVVPPVSNLFAVSFDPGPDVTVTNGFAYNNRDAVLTPKFDVNSLTNSLGGADRFDPRVVDALYAGADFRWRWLPKVTNRLAAIGFAAPEALAWNLANFIDGDRIPQSDHPRPWQQPWPVEDVPLINELAVAQVPFDYDGQTYTNHYAPAVELWYPFVTNSIVERDEAMLVVAVYTNWPGDGVKDVEAGTGTGGDLVMSPDPGEGFVFSNRIARMACGTDTEFVVAAMPPPFISFPATVSNTVTGLIETRHLPLGIVTYDAYTDGAVPPVQTRTVTNEIRLLARVRLGDRWVDEAMGYDPRDPDRDTLPAFRDVCGYEIDDPRQNGYPGNWTRYAATQLYSRDPSAEPGSSAWRYVCTLSGATNRVCDPWRRPYGQGLPLEHFNHPLQTAGDMGYLQQPQRRGLGQTGAVTSLWQSICLADPLTLGTNAAGYAFGAGSIFEFFTTRATNTPVRGLVHYSTCWTNVVRALLADVPVGWEGYEHLLDDDGLNWMTDAFFQAQRGVYTRYVPLGVGDMCFGFGIEPAFVDGGYTNWPGSLGNDLKEDLLRGLARHVSFRQHVFVVLLAGRAVAPSGRVMAEQRAAVTVLRDAYTGRWKVHAWEWLTE